MTIQNSKDAIAAVVVLVTTIVTVFVPEVSNWLVNTLDVMFILSVMYFIFRVQSTLKWFAIVTRIVTVASIWIRMT